MLGPNPTRMHCRRVASVAQVVAHQLFLSTEQKALLYGASLLHHSDTARFALTDEIRDVLECFNRPGSGTEEHRLLGEIVRLADAYDCEYEFKLLDLREGAAGGLWPSRLVDALEQIGATAAVGEPKDWSLPSFAAAAARILALMSRATVSVHNLEEAARTDPAIAGKLVQLANSALFGSRTPVSTLGAAVTRLGFCAHWDGSCRGPLALVWPVRLASRLRCLASRLRARSASRCSFPSDRPRLISSPAPARGPRPPAP